MRPDAGYPAEFGFTFAKNPVVMYASTVHTPAGYRLRVLVPGVPEEIALLDSRLTFYGEPGKLNGTRQRKRVLDEPRGLRGGRALRPRRNERVV